MITIDAQAITDSLRRMDEATLDAECIRRLLEGVRS